MTSPYAPTTSPNVVAISACRATRLGDWVEAERQLRKEARQEIRMKTG